MDIYTEDSHLDIGAARSALDATAHIGNDAVKRHRYAELQIATLLDIAASLRIVALEAAVNGLHDDLALAKAYPESTEPDEEIERDFLLVGDLVHVIGETEPGEVVALGVDSGEPFADVDFAVAKGMRYYVRNLERLVGDAADQHIADTRAEEAAIAALPTVGDELEDGTDPDIYDVDIDADFDGEPTPAADDALEILKANEAARKAAKKKGSKK